MLWLLLFLVFISIFIKQTINNLGTGLLRIVVKQLGCAENPIIEENCYLRGSSELSLSLSRLRNWYSKIKKGMISLIGNICLTGNSLGSDLLRLNPRWRGGRLLVVFLSLRISTLVRF